LAEVFETDAEAMQPAFALGARWDSVAVLATMALIDEQFDVTLPPDELTRCTCVADLLSLVDQSVIVRSAGP
jgi:acyl carrier protein